MSMVSDGHIFEEFFFFSFTIYMSANSPTLQSSIHTNMMSVNEYAKKYRRK